MFKTYHIKWGILLFIAFAIIGFLEKSDHFGFDQLPILGQGMLFCFCNVFVCWFIHHYFILHSSKNLGNLPKGIISNITAVCIILLLDYLLTRLNILPAQGHATGFKNSRDAFFNLTASSFISIFIYIIINNIQINITLQRSQLENEQLKHAQLRAQLLSLQQQISPHFLFNSLSTLKTIAADHETKTYVVQLANVYRYLLSFNELHLASVKDEITFMKSYLYILQERFEHALQIFIDVPDEFLSYNIPPLSLQLLIENAIKHNVVSPEQPLNIRVYTDQTPAIVIENGYQPKLSVEESTGKGLQNIKDRYHLLGGKEIQILRNDSQFKVTLPLLQS